MVSRHSDSGWLLHLGAGRSSLSTLRAARARGLRTIVVDIDADAPGVEHSDLFIERSRNDTDDLCRAVAEHASGRTIAGCVTSSSDEAALRAAAALCEAHDLPGLRMSAIDGLIDRSTWKQRLARRSIQTPASMRIATPDELDRFLRDHTPVLVKPESGGRGSLGVACIRRGDVRRRDLYDDARKNSSSDLVLAEAYVAGEEYSVDGVVRSGQFEMLHLARKFSARNLRGTLPTGYAWGPSDEHVRSDQDPRWEAYVTLATQTAGALGLDETFLSLDVIDDGERSYIIDVGCQLDAKVEGGLEFAGLDAAALRCAIATGEGWADAGRSGTLSRGFASRFFYANNDGRLAKQDSNETTTLGASSPHWQKIGMPAFRHQLAWERAAGAPVARPRSVSDLVVCAFVEAEDRDRAWLRANEIEANDLFTIDEAEDCEAHESSAWTTKGSSSS